MQTAARTLILLVLATGANADRTYAQKPEKFVLPRLNAGVSSQATVEDDLPNILLIVSEDNGPELGCYGDPYVRTPVLDKLAADGVRFEQAYVPQSGCSQSRAAFLTGTYPHQNGQIGLATWKFRMYRENMPNIVRSLKREGYRTGIIGKLHVNPESAFPFDYKRIPSANFGRKKIAQYAEASLEFFTASDQPFFLSVNYPDPHRPFLASAGGLPKRLLTEEEVEPLPYIGLDSPELRVDTANYYNCMSRLDSLVGDLLASLARSGKADNTLIVYFGDHGADMLRGKRTSYEGGLRIPLIIRWPSRAKSGQVRRELVSTLDLMPTLLDATRAKPVAGLAGRSLIPLLRGETPVWREYLFTEFHTHSAHNYFPQRTVRGPRFKLIQNLMPGQINPGHDFTLHRFYPALPSTIKAAPQHVHEAYRAMRQPREFELYDLQEDPYEFRNLADDPRYSRPLAELKRELAAWRERTSDPLLDAANVRRLKAEIDACFENSEPRKDRLTLTYPDYFFGSNERAAVPRAK